MRAVARRQTRHRREPDEAGRETPPPPQTLQPGGRRATRIQHPSPNEIQADDVLTMDSTLPQRTSPHHFARSSGESRVAKRSLSAFERAFCVRRAKSAADHPNNGTRVLCYTSLHYSSVFSRSRLGQRCRARVSSLFSGPVLFIQLTDLLNFNGGQPAALACTARHCYLQAIRLPEAINIQSAAQSGQLRPNKLVVAASPRVLRKPGPTRHHISALAKAKGADRRPGPCSPLRRAARQISRTMRALRRGASRSAFWSAYEA